MLAFKIVVLGLALWGCEDLEEPAQGSQTAANPATEAPQSEIHEVLTEELITTQTFVAKVKAGDKLAFRIKGWREKSQFAVSNKVATATWSQRECSKEYWENLPNPGWIPKNHWGKPSMFQPTYHNFDQCSWVEKSAPCRLRYREKRPSLKEILYPEDDFLAYPLRVVLGDKFHPLVVTSVGREFFEGVLEVTEEMLKGIKEGPEDASEEALGDLFLDVANPASSTIDVGFLWFENCPGQHALNFAVDSSLQTWSDQNVTRHQFLVSVTLETTTKGAR